LDYIRIDCSLRPEEVPGSGTYSFDVAFSAVMDSGQAVPLDANRGFSLGLFGDVRGGLSSLLSLEDLESQVRLVAEIDKLAAETDDEANHGAPERADLAWLSPGAGLSPEELEDVAVVVEFSPSVLDLYAGTATEPEDV
jgi:hypothetical protein